MARFDRGKPQFGKQAPMPSSYDDSDMPAPGGMPAGPMPTGPAQKAMPMPMKRKAVSKMGSKGKIGRAHV